jgi:hypothetical protein
MSDRAGVDARAYVVQAQQTKAAGWGMEKYANYTKVDAVLKPVYNDFRAGKMAVGEYAERFYAPAHRDASTVREPSRAPR